MINLQDQWHGHTHEVAVPLPEQQKTLQAAYKKTKKKVAYTKSHMDTGGPLRYFIEE